jgi:ferredoxin
VSEPDVRVEVDRGLCIGSGNCVRLARGAFALDQDGFAIVVDPSASDVTALSRAERSCPAGAIRLVRPARPGPDDAPA